MRMFTKDSKIAGTKRSGTMFQYRGKSEPFGWREAGGILGLAGGLLCNLFGLILTAVAWFMSTEGIGPAVHSVGTALLIINIPFLIGGAHCLDLAEKKKRVAVLTNQLIVHRVGVLEKDEKFKMTWREIKNAVEEADVDEDEEICLIHCENGNGDKTFHKIKLGRAIKLAENVSARKARKDAEGCAV